MCNPNRFHYNEIMKYPTLLTFEFEKYPCYFFYWQVDMVTPMCSQLTYEGLLDEVDCKTSSMPKNILI